MDFDNKYRKKEDNMKKGFTLIELLAVIIILAVIALIATPIVLNVVDNAKESARKSSVAGYADAVKLARTEAQFNNLPFNDNDLSIETNTNNVRCNEVTFDTTMGIVLTGCYVDDYTGHAYNYSKGVVTPDVPDTNAPIVTAKASLSGVTDNISSYFNFEANGHGIITSIVCTEGENTVTLVSLLNIGSHNITCTATKANNMTASATKTIVVKTKHNSPDLLTNMVPIKYVVDHWVYADINDEWYNYDNKEWANAVVLNSGVTKNVNDTISESDIALWYVWIPRYKYTMFNGNYEAKDPQVINVTFETETISTGTVKCHDALGTTDGDGNVLSETCWDDTQDGNAIVNGESTYTHPAFCLGTKNDDGSCNGTELRGIWVGKFEVSSDTACEITTDFSTAGTECDLATINPLIKPGVTSWRGAFLSTFYNAIKRMNTTYGITNGDTHMIKNMEWGAVAYLKQSQFGLGLTDVAINDNQRYTVFNTGGGVGNAYKTNIAQSTTGNIYGIYDMTGGASEAIMGNTLNSSLELEATYANFTTLPEAKYYDSYSPNRDNYVIKLGKLGDSTKETIKVLPTNTNGGTASWDNKGTTFPVSVNAGNAPAWFCMSTLFGKSRYRYSGNAYKYGSTRAVLTKAN